jgi:hypothetical protein
MQEAAHIEFPCIRRGETPTTASVFGKENALSKNGKT